MYQKAYDRNGKPAFFDLEKAQIVSRKSLDDWHVLTIYKTASGRMVKNVYSAIEGEKEEWTLLLEVQSLAKMVADLSDPYFRSGILNTPAKLRADVFVERYGVSEKDAEEIVTHISREFFGYPSRETWLARLHKDEHPHGNLDQDLLEFARTRIVWDCLEES